MYPTLTARPFHREGWVFEEKYDGWRILACKGDGKVHLVSRNGRDHSRRFGELTKVIGALPESTLTLDGEVAIFDEHLISRFEWLRHGTHESFSTPPIYMVFDVLKVGSQDLRQEPLRTRRKVLEGLLDGQRLLLPARRLSGNGVGAWREVQQRGYEGFVAKDESSLYVGGRTLSWLKVKQPIIGWGAEDSTLTDPVAPQPVSLGSAHHIRSLRRRRAGAVEVRSGLAKMVRDCESAFWVRIKGLWGAPRNLSTRLSGVPAQDQKAHGSWGVNIPFFDHSRLGHV